VTIRPEVGAIQVAETICVPAARRGFAERERRLPGFPPHRTEALPFLAQGSRSCQSAEKLRARQTQTEGSAVMSSPNSRKILKCYRLAAEARRIADAATDQFERADFLKVEQR
jgi:hypothetical protein